MPPDTSSAPEKPEDDTSGRFYRYSYLPYLTLVLLLLMGAWFVKHYVIDQPSTAQQLRVASFEKALRLIPDKYAGDITEEELYRAAMQAMMDRLGGRFSGYMTAPQQKQLEIETRGSYGGIGAVLAREDGSLVIVDVKEDAPAEEAGLKAEDRILKVGGSDVTDLPLGRAVKLIRGKAGSSVELLVRRASSGETEKVTVSRDTIDLEAVTGEMAEGGDVGILTVQRMGRKAADQVRKRIGELKEEGARGLVLDLRDNPGGLMEEAVDITDLFLASGVIISVDGRAGRESRQATAETVVPPDWPIVVLVNGRTASAGEIVAGTLKHHDRATIVGTRTLGKGAVNQVYSLPDGSALTLTVAHYRAAGEVKVADEGIKPDKTVGELPEPGDRPPEEVHQAVREAREKQMEAALELLREELDEQ